MNLLQAARRFWDALGYDADFWRGPVILGAALAGLTWLVWYFTKTPCTADNALRGLCNPGVVASFINVDIMSRCTAAWLGATTLTGGINAIMLSRERERTEEANRRADEAWRELAEERKRSDERIEALISQANEERQRAAEERQLSAEERQQAAEERRVMMSTIAELTNAITELRRQNNGNSAGGQD
ncbi:MAG: hypothetical protein OXL37_12760 [Chloroflexota bacterium]|nr:hypothetical protein [Chloroflexota bacterium]MDE2959367.1 hypothetical protein [Chloroflexota bacterium]